MNLIGPTRKFERKSQFPHPVEIEVHPDQMILEVIIMGLDLLVHPETVPDPMDLPGSDQEVVLHHLGKDHLSHLSCQWLKA